jgi:hypothetical protein
MRLSPCRFNLPLTDNAGQPIAPEIIIDLQRDLLTHFCGFTIHPTSQGRWQSREGRVYQEEQAGPLGGSTDAPQQGQTTRRRGKKKSPAALIRGSLFPTR